MRFFCLLLVSIGLSPGALAQPEGAAAEEAFEAASAEAVVGTAGTEELSEAEIDALIEAQRERRKAQRARRNAFVRREYTRELLALLMLCVLWLLTRKHNRDGEALRPVRVSPVTPEELGRAIFGIVRSGDSLAYRALYLTGGEARGLFGAAGVEVYLEGRTGTKLTAAMESLSRRVPVGAQYKGCFIQEEICHLQLLGSDGQKLDLPAGRVALVGAVIRLVSPA